MAPSRSIKEQAVQFIFFLVVSELLLCTFPFLLVLAFVEYYVVPGEKGMALSKKWDTCSWKGQLERTRSWKVLSWKVCSWKVWLKFERAKRSWKEPSEVGKFRCSWKVPAEVGKL